MARRFGSVRRLSSGRYQATYESTDTGGRQVARSFDTEREAEDWLAEQRTVLRRGTWRDPRAGAVSLGGFFALWLAGRRLAPRTAELYAWLWSRCLADQLGSIRLDRLDRVTVRRWHAGLSSAGDVGPVTVAKAYRLLASVMADAVRDELIARTPCVLVGAGIEPRRQIRTLTVDEVEDVADAMPSHLRALVLLAGYGGLRWGEVAGLAPGDVGAVGRTVTVQRTLTEVSGRLLVGPPKTAAGYRTVVLPASVGRELVDHVERFSTPGFVFTVPSGVPLRRCNFQRSWVKATATADVRGVRFHDLRHTAATLATRNGATVKEVQSRLGHASPEAALRYQHVVAGADAALADRLDRLRRGR